MLPGADARFMDAAIALSLRGRGRTTPNPNVGCLIVRNGTVIGRGWTQPGGRPHAEATALDSCDARGADIYVTLEPCTHESERGPACADLLMAAAPARVIVAASDPDPRTNGKGLERLRAAGIAVHQGLREAEARRAMAGFFARQEQGRPHVTLKIAMSLDGRIALPDGTSQWITGPEARAHAHVERAAVDMIVVGRGTAEADHPRLDVRLTGLEDRRPRRGILTHEHSNYQRFVLKADQPDWVHLAAPEEIARLDGVDRVLIEGGAGAAAAFVAADLVDRLLIYRAPILIGEGLPALGDIGLGDLAAAHGRWQSAGSRALGADRLETFERT